MNDQTRPNPPLPDPLPHPVVDNHCHLDLAAGPEGEPLAVDEALSLAASVGVPRIVQVGCDLDGSEWAMRTAREYPEIVATVALHPNEAPRLAESGELNLGLAEIDRLAEMPEVVAVGETGLDYYRTGPEGWPAQHESFRAHIAIAKRHGKTLVIHDRDAHLDVLRLLDDEGAPDRVVMHCFSGDAEFARLCVERGFWLSFAGTVTFKNAEPLREALRNTPLGKVLVETDAPYLAPDPYRGRRNASYLVPVTVRAMAAATGQELGALCEAIDTNTAEAFGRPW